MLSYFDKKIEKENYLEGEFVGKVVDNVDPQQLNRVRVALYGITDKIDKNYLPFYFCQTPLSSNPNSKAFVPPIGSEVIVIFPTKDIYNGIVISQLPYNPPNI